MSADHQCTKCSRTFSGVKALSGHARHCGQDERRHSSAEAAAAATAAATAKAKAAAAAERQQRGERETAETKARGRSGSGRQRAAPKQWPDGDEPQVQQQA